jgi:hypothetical protein
MGGNAQQWLPEPGRPLSTRTIVLGAVLVGGLAVVAVVALYYFYGGGTAQDRAGLDVVRTAGTLVVGIAGIIAVLLVARRQRSTELSLAHHRELAATTARDAVEQRIIELCARAVDQLGSAQAPVRMGGLHALEWLAQNHPNQRQTIVDVICAYLRMPYALPDEEPPGEDAPADARTRYEQRRQELQVRLTAQRILTAHLRTDAGDAFWPDVDLDLTEAHLPRLNLANCRIRNARFSSAQFSGTAWFDGAQFCGIAGFRMARFGGDAGFSGARFGADAGFSGVQFSGDAGFEGARFSGCVWFDGAQFFGIPTFVGAQFARNAGFTGARVRLLEDHVYSWPATWTTRKADDGDDAGWLYLVRGENP